MKSLIGMLFVLSAVSALPAQAINPDDPIWVYDRAAAEANVSLKLDFDVEPPVWVTLREWGASHGIPESTPWYEVLYEYGDRHRAHYDAIAAQQIADELSTRPAAIEEDLRALNRILRLGRNNTSYEAALMALGLYNGYLERADNLPEPNFEAAEAARYREDSLRSAAELGIAVPEGALQWDIDSAVTARRDANSPSSGGHADFVREADPEFGIDSDDLRSAREYARSQLPRWGFEL